MRVLIVSQYFWPESFRINDVANTFLDKGVEVEVLTGKPNYPRGEIFSGPDSGLLLTLQSRASQTAVWQRIHLSAIWAGR